MPVNQVFFETINHFLKKLQKIKPGCEFIFTAKIIGKLF